MNTKPRNYLKLFSALLFFSIFVNCATAQNANANEAVKQTLMVRFEKGVDPVLFCRQYNAKHSTAIQYNRPLIQPKNIHALSYFATEKIDLSSLRTQKGVVYALADRKVRYSKLSSLNDPRIGEQYYIARTRTDDAWELTTGDTTSMGKEIVIGVIDQGFDVEHVDLIDNVYINRNEVPNDGIDNDGNGLIDDINGWDLVSETTNVVKKGNHGTQVSGVAASTGDNGIFGAGVAPDSKLLVMSNPNDAVSTIIEGYGHMARIRSLFNDTNGQKGAFIVAVNSSFGIFPEPDDPPLFCDNPEFAVWKDAMETMGDAGILAINAAFNSSPDYNIDIRGDVPSTCPNDNVISVHGTDNFDNIALSFGPTTIDIAAPATDILTTEADSEVGTTEGNSFATPQVAGLVALLYGMRCPELEELVQDDPKAAALQVKAFILDGASKLQQLEGKNVSNGRMNSMGSVQELLNYCDGIKPSSPLRIRRISPNPATTEAIVEFDLPSEGTYSIRIHDAMGRLLNEDTFEVTAFNIEPYSIPNLSFYKNGLYFITVEDGQQRDTKSFVITY